MDHATLKELQSALEEQKKTLINELQGIARPDPERKGEWETLYPKFEEGESGSLDVEANEVEEYELRLSAEESLHSRLLAVTHALLRIDKGTYGICARCGKPIPLERLRANPSAECHTEHTT